MDNTALESKEGMNALEYINDINIVEAVIHILDANSEEPILNEFTMELNEEIHNFLLKHLDKALKDEELRYAVFNGEKNIVRELSHIYLNGESDLLSVSKELARQMFVLLKLSSSIPSCDLLIISFSTEHGPMLGILKLDYTKNYTHNINFVDDKIGIEIVPQFTGLPGSSQRIQKCAFIKPVMEGQSFNLMVIDKGVKTKDTDENTSNYFVESYLGCSIVDNERDMTKTFVKAAENWTRKKLKEDAHSAEAVRSTIKKVLREEDMLDIKGLSENLFADQYEAQEDFVQYMTKQGVQENISVDKEWVDKKLKRVRLKIDKDIDLYINEAAYDDGNRFEIQRNGDGTINMIIKHVKNYMEK